MNILHLIAPVSFGGGESLLLNLLKQKNDRYNESIALIYSSETFQHALKDINIQYYRLRKKNIGQGHSKFFAIFDLIVNFWLFIPLFFIIRKNSIHTLHVHGFPSVILGVILKLLNQNLHIIYTHHGYRNPPKLKVEKFFFEWLYNQYDILSTVSFSAKCSLEASFQTSKQWQVIYNCVSELYFTKKQYNNHSEKSTITFVQIGRFVQSKNHELVISSFKQLSPEQKEKFKIVFIGDGPYLEKMRILVSRSQLDQYFQFKGFLSSIQIVNELDQADYALFPSNENEAFGIAAIECLARGLPILGLNTPIMNEIVNRYGLLKTPETFFKGFQEITMMNFINKEMLNYAQQYNPHNTKQQYIALYKSLIQS